MNNSEIKKLKTNLQNWLNRFYEHRDFELTNGQENDFYLDLGDLWADESSVGDFEQHLDDFFDEIKDNKTYPSLSPQYEFRDNLIRVFYSPIESELSN